MGKVCYPPSTKASCGPNARLQINLWVTRTSLSLSLSLSLCFNGHFHGLAYPSSTDETGLAGVY